MIVCESTFQNRKSNVDFLAPTTKTNEEWKVIRNDADLNNNNKYGIDKNSDGGVEEVVELLAGASVSHIGINALNNEYYSFCLTDETQRYFVEKCDSNVDDTYWIGIWSLFVADWTSQIDNIYHL